MTTAPDDPTPTRVRPRGGLRYVLATFGTIALVLAAGIAFLHTQTALELAMREAEHASDGRLVLENPSGTLLSTIRVGRIAWTGPTARLVATDVALDWSVRALWSRRLVIRGLGVLQLSYEAAPSTEPGQLPASLALPFEIEIDHVAVGRLDWRVGERSGTVTGLAFSYRGGAGEHRIGDLALVFARGTFAGSAQLGAQSPFPLEAALGMTGDASLANLRAGASLKGTLGEIVARIDAHAGDANATATARLAPLANAPLRALDVDARGIDLSAFDPALPTTRLSGRVAAAPAEGGLAGTASIRNDDAGAWDARRLPVENAEARFALGGDELAISDLAATLRGGGRVSGNGRLSLADPLHAAAGAVDLRDVDLARLHGRLVTTRLAGRVSADVEGTRQRVTADLAQQDLALAFDATIDGARVDARRVRARAGNGEFVGRGNVSLDGARPFEVAGRFDRLDPSRFGQFPSGALTGDLALSGALDPAWSVRGRVALATGSRLVGVALSGEAKGSVAPGRVRDVAAEIAVGGGRVKASGSAGAPGDRLEFAIDAIRLADVAALVPVAAVRSLEGTVRARGSLALEPGGMGGSVEVHAEQLRYDGYASDRADARVELAPGGSASVPVAIENRHVDIDLVGTGVRVGTRRFERVGLAVQGSLASHRASANVAGEGLAASASAHGGARAVRAQDGSPSYAWSGSVDSLANAGRWPFRLESPCSVSLDRQRIAVGAATIAVADGRVRVRDFVLDDGHVSTHGDFDGLAAATAMRLAGLRQAIGTDLVLAGEWSVAASPRLNGSLAIRRQGGDVYAGESDAPDGTRFAFGLTTLSLDARLAEDSLDARLTVRSTRAGNVDGRIQLAAVPGAPPGRLTLDAPVDATVTADLATLRPLQPWLGTVAVVDGRARLAASARGRLADPALHLELAADGLRVDAPQYALHLTDGRLRARDEGSDIVLSEFSIRGGDGRFTASGTIASLAPDRGSIDANARLSWKAEHFRLLNRPDLRLVIGGAGTSGIEGGKLALRGTVDVVEGNFDYARSSAAQLSDDVIVVGGDSPRARETAAVRVPLVLDLDVDLGSALSFRGEGLETGLRGRVHVTTAADGRLAGRGTIRAVNGTYFAFGQRLAIDRGSLIFDGPLDNPALDIVALRRNQAVEAGVAVTGTVKVPIVTLVSNPPVPDSEKLSWLVLGRGTDNPSGSDAAALQAATAALLSRGGKPLTTQIAQQFGLDDLSFGSASGQSATTAASTRGIENQVVVFGKRLSDRLSIAYQQGLTAATNVLRLDYALTRTLTVRAEAGAISSVGIYYRRTFD